MRWGMCNCRPVSQSSRWVLMLVWCLAFVMSLEEFGHVPPRRVNFCTVSMWTSNSIVVALHKKSISTTAASLNTGIIAFPLDCWVLDFFLGVASTNGDTALSLLVNLNQKAMISSRVSRPSLFDAEKFCHHANAWDVRTEFQSELPCGLLAA